jgi:hypothetical protein
MHGKVAVFHFCVHNGNGVRGERPEEGCGEGNTAMSREQNAKQIRKSLE